MADPQPTDPIIPPIVVTPKPGWKSSEFWLSMLAVLFGALLSTGIVQPGTKYDKLIGVGTILLAAMGYTAGRSAVKSAALKMCLALALLPLLGGCALFNPAATDQQKLDSTKQTYTNANTIISILIDAGYIAKNDQALKDAIFQASATIRDALAKAQDYLATGNKVTFQFWFDTATNALTRFLQYEADGERKHKLSNPATRPALPGKVTVDYGPGNYFAYRRRGAGDYQSRRGAESRGRAYPATTGVA